MPSGPLGLMLRRLIGRPRPADLGDDELLQRFVVCRDMGAFETLVQRYGPLVLGVCRRVLQDEHDAEDAFQATFLVFARRASSIHNQGAVGSWLAGTAYRISLKARAAAVRRRVQEREAGAQLPTDQESSEAWDEMRLVLDEELNHLPEKYRVPLVLCYLEGKTNEAAARELGWAPGSMSYRLAQARERLRERLVHRGVGLAPSLLGPALATYALAEVPSALGGLTAKAGLLFEAGQTVAGLVTPQAVALAEGALRAFDLVKALWTALFGVLVAVSIGSVATLLLHRGFGDDVPLAETEPDPPIVKALDEENRIAVLFSEETQRFGISCTKLPDPRRPGKFKLLTSDERGQNNNTRVLVDGADYRFGFETPNVRWYRDRDKKLWKGVKVGDRKWVSIMEWKTERLRITQSVQIVVGEQTRLYDTALVKYAVQNLDKKPHTVGVRVLLDTFIGGNDGVPFLIPPSTDAPSGRLLDTMAVFEKEQVPPFVRALESADLNDRSTVAEMGLKLRGLEPLSKVVLCRWPDEQGGGQASWEWPFEPMNADPQKPDSCVVLYWNAMEVFPAEKAGKLTLGFTYGLGRMADTADRAPMRLLASGSTQVGRTFVLTFYIRGEAGETVRLRLPEGMQLTTGQQLVEQVIPPHKERGYAQMSWQVEAAKVGKYTVRASVGRHDTKVDVHVRESSIFD